jgi:hypothetical protein
LVGKYTKIDEKYIGEALKSGVRPDWPKMESSIKVILNQYSNLDKKYIIEALINCNSDSNLDDVVRLLKKNPPLDSEQIGKILKNLIVDCGLKRNFEERKSVVETFLQKYPAIEVKDAVLVLRSLKGYPEKFSWLFDLLPNIEAKDLQELLNELVYPTPGYGMCPKAAAAIQRKFPDLIPVNPYFNELVVDSAPSAPAADRFLVV